MLSRPLFLAFGAVVVAACSSRPSHPPTTDAVARGAGAGGGGDGDGGTVGPDDASGDVLVLDAQNSGVACAASVVNTAAELNIDQSVAPATFSGPFEIRGTIIFSTQVPLGATVILGLANKQVKTFDEVSEQASGQLGKAATEVTYALHHQMAGVYYLMFAVDLNGNKKIDAGDLGGFFKGSAGAPITDGLQAEPVTVASAPICGIDWGIGQI